MYSIMSPYSDKPDPTLNLSSTVTFFLETNVEIVL